MSLLLVLGGASLISADPRFVMIKPSLAMFVIGGDHRLWLGCPPLCERGGKSCAGTYGINCKLGALQ